MKPTILVVDDEAINIEYVAEVLSNKYDIKVAYNGLQALKIVEKIKIDLILLDINMPELDGFAVATTLKEKPDTNYIPIIFLTGMLDDSFLVKAFEVGGKDYIKKPFNKVELEARVRNHIKTSFLEDELRKKVLKVEQQQKLLIQQSKITAMNEMIHVLSHQWRQPLSAISTVAARTRLKTVLCKFSDRDETAFKEHQDYMNSSLEKIEEYVRFLATIIDDFRKLLQPSKDKKDFNILDAVVSARNLLDMKLKSAYVECNINFGEFPKEKFQYNTYEIEFKQSIVNIISNSIDAFETNGIEKRKIEINLHYDYEYITIAIEDNAGGIKENILDKIFEPYSSTKLEQNGTGLGLYMVKTIIEKNMNGSVKASNTQEGVKFIIKLPLV